MNIFQQIPACWPRHTSKSCRTPALEYLNRVICVDQKHKYGKSYPLQKLLLNHVKVQCLWKGIAVPGPLVQAGEELLTREPLPEVWLQDEALAAFSQQGITTPNTGSFHDAPLSHSASSKSWF
ncbi:hypothetical protein CHARACLAT_019623 [Characodon lateralis]|uniref:Uncharacterized protein n=1 Tax=Characodon lateralis TaxID=208331 RepID=A0ABU7EV22_9TELE|nr:hypothetical protein [Characodon lateralis]